MTDEVVAHDVRAALSGGDLVYATLRVLEAYGAEVFGFLAGVLEDVGAAREVYATIGERARERLVTFGCPDDPRTWLYGLACRAIEAHRESQDPGRRAPSHAPFSAGIQAPADAPTSAARALAQLRSRLPSRDRELLVLRVDRRLSWDELADVFLGDDASQGDRLRETARLRSRYRMIKHWLVGEAAARGIVGSG